MNLVTKYALLGAGLANALPQNLGETTTVTNTFTETVISSVCDENCRFDSLTGKVVIYTETLTVTQTDCNLPAHNSVPNTRDILSEDITTIVETEQITVVVTNTPAPETPITGSHSLEEPSPVFDILTELPIPGTYSSSAMESSAPCDDTIVNTTWATPNTGVTYTERSTAMAVSGVSSSLIVDGTCSSHGTGVGATATAGGSAGYGANTTSYVWPTEHPWTSESPMFTSDLTRNDPIPGSSSSTFDGEGHSTINVASSSAELEDSSFALPVEPTTISSPRPGYGGGYGGEYTYETVDTTSSNIIFTAPVASSVTLTTSSEFITDLTSNSPEDGTISSEYSSSASTQSVEDMGPSSSADSETPALSTGLVSNSREGTTTLTVEDAYPTGYPLLSEISEPALFSTDLTSNSPENGTVSVSTSMEDELASTYPTTFDTSIYTSTWDDEASSTAAISAPSYGGGWDNEGDGDHDGSSDDDKNNQNAWDHFYEWLRSWWEKTSGHN